MAQRWRIGVAKREEEGVVVEGEGKGEGRGGGGGECGGECRSG